MAEPAVPEVRVIAPEDDAGSLVAASADAAAAGASPGTADVGRARSTSMTRQKSKSGKKAAPASPAAAPSSNISPSTAPSTPGPASASGGSSAEASVSPSPSTTVDIAPVPPCDCLEELLSYPQGALIFTQFLTSIGQSDTQLVFWFACMDYRHRASTDRDVRRVQARRIYDTFLSAHAPSRVSVADASIISAMEEQLSWPSLLMFDGVALAALDDLERDLFPMFRSSKIYQAVTDPNMPRKPFSSTSARIRARNTTSISRRRRSTLTSATALAPLQSSDLTHELVHAEVDKSVRTLMRIEKALLISGIAGPRVPVPPEQLMRDLHIDATELDSVPSTSSPRSTGSAPGSLPTATAKASVRRAPTVLSSVPSPAAANAGPASPKGAAAPVDSSLPPLAAAPVRHGTMVARTKTKAKRAAQAAAASGSAAAEVDTTRLAAPSANMRTTISAPDMQKPDDIASASSALLLKPIQPSGRGLRRFVLRGAAYDKIAQAWVNIPDQMLTKEMLGYRTQRLSLLTLNVTHEKFNNKARYGAVIEQIESSRPDVIFLQEVTPTFLQRLHERPAVRQSYYLSDASGANFGERKFGQIIMSRLPFVELRSSELRSRNGALAIVGVVVVNARRIALSSVDLDDHPDDDTLRADQLASVIGMVRGLQCDDTIIGGSFASDLRFNQMVDLGLGLPYEDLWLKAAAPATPDSEHAAAADMGPTVASTPHQRLMNVVANPSAREGATAGRPAAAQDVEFNTLAVPTEEPRVRMPSVSQRVTLARRARIQAGPDGTATLVASSRANSDDIVDPKGMGHTVDPANNSIARTIFTTKPPFRRPDRLLLFSNHHHWNHVRTIHLVGTEPLAGYDDLWMSAHYGISAIIDTATGPTPSTSAQSFQSHTSGASGHAATDKAPTTTTTGRTATAAAVTAAAVPVPAAAAPVTAAGAAAPAGAKPAAAAGDAPAGAAGTWGDRCVVS